MKSIKEIIIGTIENGKKILKEIEIKRKNGVDILTEKNQNFEQIRKYHQPYLDLKVIKIKEETNIAKTFTLVSNNNLPLPVFQAGQYINVFVNINGITTSRPYSISSSPSNKGYYEITVARIKDGFVSDYLLDKIKVNDTLRAVGPMGHFKINPVAHSKHSVFLAGGSGVTPFYSMIVNYLYRNTDRTIDLFYGVRKEEYAFFNKHFKELSESFNNFNYHLVISDDKNYKGLQGFIDAKLIKETLKSLKNKTYYICGPEVMINFCEKELLQAGVLPKDVKREIFSSPLNIKNEPLWPKDVNINKEVTINFNGHKLKTTSGKTILEALENNKINDVNVGCRSGICGYCRMRLKKGNVYVPESVKLRHTDEVFNFLHSCKTYPLTDIEISLD